MKSFLFIALLFSAISYQCHAQNNADKIIGTYHSPKKDAKISIYKKGGQYFGKIIWSIKNFKDTKNPNPALRSRDIVGSDFMYSFKYNDGEYVDGKIYDATTGKTYSGKMWLTGNNINLRGYFGISLLGRTEVFQKI